MIQTILFFAALSNSASECQPIEQPGLSMQAPKWAFVVGASRCVSRVGDFKAVSFLRDVETVVAPFED